MHASTLLFLGVFNLQSSPKLTIRITNQKKTVREREDALDFSANTHAHTRDVPNENDLWKVSVGD